MSETETAGSALDKANVHGLLAAVFRRELTAEFLYELRRPALIAALDRKSTRLNSSHIPLTRMPSSA